MTQEEYITKKNELHDVLHKLAIEKESHISAINDAMNERIKAAKEWAAEERRKVSDEIHERRKHVRSELTRLHFEFHESENQQSLLQNRK